VVGSVGVYTPPRNHRYIGPPELRAAVRPGGEGRAIGSPADFDAWAARRPPAELDEPFTFMVDAGGLLRLAPRRSEHVACAGGAPVLGAGEVAFARRAGRWTVGEVSNQSTGYRPDPDASWPAVAAALDRAGLDRPAFFTHVLLFRLCTGCREQNTVHDLDFTCLFCGDPLPERWNADPHAP